MNPNQADRNMQPGEIIRILSSLAHGVDPVSGLPFSGDSLFNKPDIIRALFAAVDMIRAGTDRPVRPSGPGSGQRWTPELDNELRERYLAGAALPELMQSMGRGRGALIARLKLLGLIDDADHVRD